MNKQELIERIEDFPCEASLVTEMIRINKNTLLGWVKELDLPKQIKLKDVIVRMEGLSEHTRSEWLNDILYKFGSDYGTLKYKDGYEQGKLEGSMIPYEEPQKVTVSQFVADWIEYCKKHNFTLFGCLDPVNGFESLADEIFEGDNRKCIRWCRKESNNFARAWLDGYTVEKEKRYEVILCNGQSLKTVYRQGEDRLDFEKVYGDLERFTRKQLEEAGFGWVFDCPGIEIEEVQDDSNKKTRKNEDKQ